MSAMQQRARFLKDTTIGPRLDLVRRSAAFANQYPWQWSQLRPRRLSRIRRSLRPPQVSTVRRPCGCSASTRPMLVTGWAATCAERFGAVPRKILDDWNTVGHVTEHEELPYRHPLTSDEVQALFTRHCLGPCRSHWHQRQHRRTLVPLGETGPDGDVAQRAADNQTAPRALGASGHLRPRCRVGSPHVGLAVLAADLVGMFN